jgi:uncharacterized protein (TIGR00299 family) protein
MGRLLYLDCVGGAAGDMLLAALIDAGAPLTAIEAGLPPVDGLGLGVERVPRCGIEGALLTVTAPPQHAHRRLRDVRLLIDRADMPTRARSRALSTFELLAQAEGAVHGEPAEEVTFHEVGALDAIADVCGVAMALEALDIEEVVASPLPLGHGTTRGAHGVLPLPAPATLQLLREAPVYGVDRVGETVTPTGAALVASLATSFGPLPSMRITAFGTGAGTRDPEDIPNVVRALIGERDGSPTAGAASLIESNLDDLLPELVPDAAAACVAAGALDVWTIPATMKQGRPGFVLSAIARPADEDAVAKAILRHTSALGARITRVHHRVELERSWEEVEVQGQTIRVKLGILEGTVVHASPEHRDCVRAAAATGNTVQAIWAAALGAGRRAADSLSES